MTRRTRTTIPAKAKTAPSSGLFCKNDLGGLAAATELVGGELEANTAVVAVEVTPPDVRTSAEGDREAEREVVDVEVGVGVGVGVEVEVVEVVVEMTDVGESNGKVSDITGEVVVAEVGERWNGSKRMEVIEFSMPPTLAKASPRTCLSTTCTFRYWTGISYGK